jgi:hypothetical protein
VHVLFVVAILTFWHHTIVECIEENSCPSNLEGVEDGSCSNTLKNPVVDNNENKDDGKDDDPACRDDHEDCQFWSKQKPSECEVNPDFMVHECKLACRVCDRQ